MERQISGIGVLAIQRNAKRPTKRMIQVDIPDAIKTPNLMSPVKKEVEEDRILTEVKKSVMSGNVKDSGYKNLYFKDEDGIYISLKQGVALKYIQNLIKAIEDSTNTIDLINDVNGQLLDSANNLRSNISDGEVLKQVLAIITNITGNQKILFDSAKTSSSNIETLMSLEKKLLQEERDIRELYGGKAKGFREDKADYESKISDIEVKTTNKFI